MRFVAAARMQGIDEFIVKFVVKHKIPEPVAR
jgi:hypothetical protein